MQESSSSNSGSGSKSVQVIEKNVRGSASSFALNLSSSNSSATTSQSSTAASSSGAASPGASPLTFSSTSHNSHQKTTLYATSSNQQSEWSDSSSSTQADIEESSSGSTSLEFSTAGFSYETTSKSQSQFSSIAESQSASDPPTSSDGTPGSASESRSLHVTETLDESESKFGFGFGSNGLEYTNEYSSNETVSDLSEHEGEWETWTLVYPELDSSAMDADNAPPPPVWVQGPNLTDGSNTTIQYNYGGDLENGFEGQFTETYHYWMDYLNDDGTVGTYQDTVPTIVTFPNTNDSDNSGASSGEGSGTADEDLGGTDGTTQMAAFSEGDEAAQENEQGLTPSGRRPNADERAVLDLLLQSTDPAERAYYEAYLRDLQDMYDTPSEVYARYIAEQHRLADESYRNGAYGSLVILSAVSAGSIATESGAAIAAVRAAIAATRSVGLLEIPAKGLQKVFDKHGANFGLLGNWNPSRAAEVFKALKDHMGAAGTKIIQGTYRGEKVIHYVDPATGVNVVTDLNGKFIGGWKLGLEQLESVLKTGRLF